MAESYDEDVGRRPLTTPAGPVDAAGIDWADVGKSIVGRGARGVTRVIGAPGDAAQAVQAMVDPLRENSGLPPAPKGWLTAPTSAEVQQAIERYTGNFYEPKTSAGKVVGGVVELGLAGRLLKNRAMPRSAKDAIAQTVLQQSMSQPVGAEPRHPVPAAPVTPTAPNDRYRLLNAPYEYPRPDAVPPPRPRQFDYSDPENFL